MAHNVRACCCAGIHCSSSLTASPIKIIKSSNYEQKLKRNPAAETAPDSEQKDENLFVSQHSSQATLLAAD